MTISRMKRRAKSAWVDKVSRISLSGRRRFVCAFHSSILMLYFYIYIVHK